MNVILISKLLGLETWQKDEPHEYFHLEGYKLEYKNRTPTKRGGGVCLYVKEHLRYKVRNDLITHALCSDGIDCLFIEIDRVGYKNIIVGVIYRPPDQDINVFNQFTDQLLSTITKNENKLVYIIGDFNINLLNEDVHALTNEFINIISSLSMYPSITIIKPTRITPTSATLIDNIFTNSLARQTAGIIMTDISDHFPIFITTNLRVYDRKNSQCDQQYVRHYSESNIRDLKAELSTVEWDNVCSSADPNTSYNSFTGKLNDLLNKCMPLKKVTPRSSKRKPKSPWISNGLLKSIRRKNLLYKKSIKKPTGDNIDKYKKFRNKLNSLLRFAKQSYYCDMLDKERNNIKNTWKVLNSIIRCKKANLSQTFISGDKTYNRQCDIATEFNTYFANIGPSLASSINHNGNDFSSYLPENINATCFFKPTHEDEIIKIINKLGSNKSPGHDLINSNLVKHISQEIAYPLKLIFNESLSNGVVPDDLKIAKVVPIYKKDNPQVFGNYRPVSVLPCLSKILERLVYNRCYELICKHNILYKKQYGFRQKHSTYMAVLDVINDLTKTIDDGMFNVGIFMDLSKAFDTIDHTILLHKLYNYGFRGVSHNWFSNYLSNRKQYVSYNGTASPKVNTSCGVPQGSLPGPLLFILYMNDIQHTSKLLSFTLFADDTTILYSHKNLTSLCDTLNVELREVCNWFKANKLSLNAKKTNLMYLGTSHQTRNIDDSKNCIYLDGVKLDRVHEAKFLGLLIDENITWKKQISSVCKTCSRNIGVMNKVKHFLPKQAMYHLYCSMVLCYLNYGILLWGNSCKEYLSKVLRLQKRALRIVSNSSYLSASKPLFDKYKTLDVFSLYKKEVAVFMFKYQRNLLPQSFDNMFTKRKDIHTYNTRNKDNYQISAHKIKGILHTGPRIWNSLPYNIKNAKSISQFKTKLYSYLSLDIHH